MVNYLKWNVAAREPPDEKEKTREWEAEYSDYPDFTRFVRIGDRREKDDGRTPRERYFDFEQKRGLIRDLVAVADQIRSERRYPFPRFIFRTITALAVGKDRRSIEFKTWKFEKIYAGQDFRRFRQCERTNCRKYFWAKPLDKRFCNVKCQKAVGAKRSRSRKLD